MRDDTHNTPAARPRVQLVWGRARPSVATAGTVAAAPAANEPRQAQPAAAAELPTLAQLRARDANNIGHAYAAGFKAGERRGYVRGWATGVVHGVVAALCVGSMALAAWLTWGPPA